MPETDKAGRIKLLMQLSYQSKDYPKAIEFGNKALRSQRRPGNRHCIVGNAYYIQNDFENTRATS